jgi:putative oxygen-independent coproporphyrinogen III oxidase
MNTVLSPSREGRWFADPGFGVYVHVPFCAHRCHYCDFNTYEGLDDLHDRYVDALVADIDRFETDQGPATSVFFGGGTPTLLQPRALGRALDAVRRSIGIAHDAEVTVEANPETVDESVFAELLAVGFNRFSVGIQSAAPHVLEALGRTHSADVALEALAAARRAGVSDLNADLIFGSPWESAKDWDLTLSAVSSASPEHVSAYALTVEEGTPLHTLVTTGRVPDVDPDLQADRHEAAAGFLRSAGFERYEVSNWATPGHASRHNLLYWSAGEYAAFGAGAHGNLGGRRFWNVRLPRAYIAAAESGTSVEAGSETLQADPRGGEALMLGLRLASGVHEPSFEGRFPGILGRRKKALDRLVSEGLIDRSREWLHLSEKGTLLANHVFHAVL